MYFIPWINWCYKSYAYKVLKMLVKVCALFFLKNCSQWEITKSDNNISSAAQ